MSDLTLHVIVTSIIFATIIAQETKNCDKIILCDDKINCRDCIRAHPCCTWCYQTGFKGQRCFPKNSPQHSKCNSRYVENNFDSTSTPIESPKFSDVKNDINEAVQLRPHVVNVNLRYGVPINITIQYKPAKHYPLELYYLMDLTRSMQVHLNTLKTLGLALAKSLMNLTENYKIAFGSYIDKPAMPYYRTDPVNFENPCNIHNTKCEKGYLFRHRLNFTKDMEVFMEKVNTSYVSGNSDDPEGGMDAIMQILLCGESLGWSTHSRKLILLVTEGTLHFAGDGLLGGFVKRNLKSCRITPSGDYNFSEFYDYPSIEELYYKLKKTKTNMIVAAKSNHLPFYEEMGKLIKEIFVGELKSDSTNVLDLVTAGYNAFVKKVKFFSSPQIPGLNVEFFSDCLSLSKEKWKTNSCDNVKPKETVSFDVQLSLTDYQSNSSAELYIEESNIQEKIKINLNFVGCMCNCSNMESNPKTCKNGMWNCGSCLCDDGWSGDDCSVRCTNELEKCRQVVDGKLSVTCSGNGDCRCSNCQCYSKRFQGKYCEYECPYDHYTDQVCKGHGSCQEGKCICNDGYSGDFCDCEKSTENCIIPGSNNTCSDNGECRCNKCFCKEGYRGQYCNQCSNCTTHLCSFYEDHVKDHVNKNPQNGTVVIKTVESRPESDFVCIYQYFEDKKKCEVYYDYKIHQNRSVIVEVTEPNCSKPMAAGIMVGMILVAFLVLAILVALIWKGKNMYKDKREYAKYLEYQKKTKHSEENPLYKNPVVYYQNPLERPGSSDDGGISWSSKKER